MSIQLFKTTTGEVALVVNSRLILEGDISDDSHRLVEQTAERLATAFNAPLLVLNMSPQTTDWEWADLLKEITLPAPEEAVADAQPSPCRKCGSLLIAGMCKDETCPYSDWPQHIPVTDMEFMSADEIVAKYGLIRAEVHSDDHAFTCDFHAEAWFIAASPDDIKDLAREEWSHCHTADAIARCSENHPRVARMFDYLEVRNAGSSETIGFECSVNPKDALQWLRKNRYGLWAQIRCEEQGIRIVEAQEPEVEGMFDWIGPNGNACDMSLNSADEAAINAVKALALDPGLPPHRLYEAFWDVSVFPSPSGKDMRQTLGPAMFCAALEYEPEDIASIAEMAIGDTWECPHFGPYHTICRIS